MSKTNTCTNMSCQPLVTYAGDRAVFSNIEPGLVSGLPTEAVEWKRSYGRNSRQVYVEVSFQPFSAEDLISTSSSLQGQPVFHTFWTDVGDIDLYRQGVKEDIVSWLNTLKKSGVTSDWMIIVVETPENRKGNKFPLRATVLDKLKQDVGGKTPDRCVALMDPSKADSRAAESMQALLHKFRQFFLQSYNKVLNKFEENIRSQREKRTDFSWNFCEYFLVQEQLAMVYENMGIYDESLIQYDELDALLTQFVLNSNVGEIPSWLDQFTKDLSEWTPLSLDKASNMKLHTKLENSNPSLLDIRNYLFSRQCSLLLQSNKPQEVAARTLSFLHNTIQELDILEVEEVVEGSKDSWVLLACLEVVQSCEANLAEGGGTQGVLTTHTAGLWSAAREKLLSLGKLCGLMPNQAPTSDQLHRVISITGGLQETDIKGGEEKEGKSPVNRLKESLSSNSAFERNYLEMCEIAISSYKHIGRIRSARLVGKDLATFYMELGQVQHAAVFLAEALKTFQYERWDKLSLQTMLDLTKCYKALGDKEKYVRMCAQIASNKVASVSDRERFFVEIEKTLEELGSDPIAMHAEDILDFISCQVEKSADDQQIIPGVKLNFSLVLRSNLPKAVTCNTLKISLSYVEPDEPEVVPDRKGKNIQRRAVQRSPSMASNNQVDLQVDTEVVTEGEPGGKLDMVEQLDYKQDKSLCAARLVCRNSNNVLKRKDSSGSILRDGTQLQKGDYSLCLELENTLIEPGTHTYKLNTVAGKEGKYMMTQMSSQMRQVDFIHPIGQSQSSFTVTSSPPIISLNRDSKELYAGVESFMMLSVWTGSKTVVEGTEICFSTSRGMLAKPDTPGGEFSSSVRVSLPAGEPFHTISARIRVKVALTNQKDSSSVEHKVTITDPWAKVDKEVFVHFIPAFYTTFQLLTALDKKFLQIFLYPLTDTNFYLSDHKMEFSAGSSRPELSMTPINKKGDVLVVNSNCEGGYLWQLDINATNDQELEQLEKPVKIKFSIAYKETKSQDDKELYEATFQFQDFLTLYTIQAKVEPAKGNEFCRAGTMCPMTVQLEQCNISQHTSLFYEVIADQAVWAVCGRQGAVVNIAQSSKQNIVIDVMPLVGGHLALPTVRLSKYIPADSGAARLDPFATGQVYNMSRSQQVHVLPPLSQHVEFVSLP